MASVSQNQAVAVETRHGRVVRQRIEDHCGIRAAWRDDYLNLRLCAAQDSIGVLFDVQRPLRISIGADQCVIDDQRLQVVQSLCFAFLINKIDAIE
jgi:hypothetical protein